MFAFNDHVTFALQHARRLQIRLQIKQVTGKQLMHKLMNIKFRLSCIIIIFLIYLIHSHDLSFYISAYMHKVD